MKDPYERLFTLLMEQEDNPMEDDKDEDDKDDDEKRLKDLEDRKEELGRVIGSMGGDTPEEIRQKEALRKDLDAITRQLQAQKELMRGKGLGKLTRLKSAVVGGGTTYIGIIQNFLKKALGTDKKRIASNVLSQ